MSKRVSSSGVKYHGEETYKHVKCDHIYIRVIRLKGRFYISLDDMYAIADLPALRLALDEGERLANQWAAMVSDTSEKPTS